MRRCDFLAVSQLRKRRPWPQWLPVFSLHKVSEWPAFAAAVIIVQKFGQVAEERRTQSTAAGRKMVVLIDVYKRLFADCFAGVSAAGGYHHECLGPGDFEEPVRALEAIHHKASNQVEAHGTPAEWVATSPIAYSDKADSTLHVQSYCK